MKDFALILLGSLGLLSCQAEEKKVELTLPITTDQIASLGDHGYTQLLGGDSTEGWERRGSEAQFTLKNGELIGHGENLKSNSFLCSEKRYSDFVIAFEMKFDHLEGNSGCMFRASVRENGRVFGYQCEHDNTPRSWTAGLYDEARRGWLVPKKKDKSPEGEAAKKAYTEQGTKVFKKDDWNTIVIKCEGDHVQIWLNGEERVNYKEADTKEQTSEGFFGFQVHSGKSCDVRWRNIFIKEL